MASLRTELVRLLDESYLDDIESLPLETIRAKRAECQEAEVSLSYLRRLAQGRLDIVHAYLDRSASGSPDDLGTLVEEMPVILSAGPGRPAGPGRLPLLLSPDTEVSELTEEIDSVLGAEGIGRLGQLDADGLRSLAADLETVEHRISRERRALHVRIDGLQAELVSRYKTGQASVDGLLS